MRPKFLPGLFLILFFSIALSLSSCDAIIEPSISKSTVTLEAPVDQYQTNSYTLNFWWDQVDHALSYHLQVVSAMFAAPSGLVLDTIVTKNTFSYTLNPGSYQWRVMAENGSSQTAFATPRSFTIGASSITQQTVMLSSPANNLLTSQGSVNFQWGSLFGATKYQLEIDTNNFINESALVYNQTVPGQQISFTLPKDQTYQWRVKAQNDTAQAQWSAIYMITYDHTPPAPVTLSSPADGVTVTSPVTLQWNAAPTAVKYKLYIYTSDDATLLSSGFPLSLTTTSYSFTLGSSGSKYYWVVTALDAAGNESVAGSQRSFSIQ